MDQNLHLVKYFSKTLKSLVRTWLTSSGKCNLIGKGKVVSIGRLQ